MSVAIDKVNAPHHADHDRPEIQRLRRAARAEGYPAEFLYKHGSGDGAHYSAQGIAAVAFGVGGAGQHGPDEYADIATIDALLPGACPRSCRGLAGISLAAMHDAASLAVSERVRDTTGRSGGVAAGRPG